MVSSMSNNHKVDASSLQLISSGSLSVSPLALKTNKDFSLKDDSRPDIVWETYQVYHQFVAELFHFFLVG